MPYVALFVRVFAIYAFCHMLTGVPTWVNYVKEMKELVDSDLGNPVLYLTIVMYVFFAILALFAIKFPLTVSKMLISKDAADSVSLNMTPADLSVVCFTVLGVYILSWAFPDFVYNCFEYWANSSVRFETPELSNIKLTLAVTILEIAIGLYLALNAKGLKNVILKLRR
jgi:hypothetical protein